MPDPVNSRTAGRKTADLAMYAGRKEFPVFNSFFRSKLFCNAGKIRKEINMRNEFEQINMPVGP